MRLRTLPLSLAGVVLGLSLAIADGAPISTYPAPDNWLVIVFLLLTTVCLQILSNLSNELGDYLRGTDNEQRQGPQYALQQGGLTLSQFKTLIGVFVGLCCVFGLAMTWISYGTILKLEPLMILLLGLCAIRAAMKYTLGKNPYGYRGLGDIFVFLFFGLVSVLGAFFMLRHTLNPKMILPACAIGFFSVGVLNVNNIRDMATDALNRVTVPIRLGERKAKVYHTLLIVLGWVCIVVFNLLMIRDLWHWLPFLTLPLYIKHIVGVWRKSGKALDPELPLLVMSTFLLSILMGLGYCAYMLA